MRRHQFDLQSVELARETPERVDCVLLVADHDDFSYEFIAAHAPLIVDSRGV
jgi:UDP-N-acetyl-D-glucosamine dehydrogenase